MAVANASKICMAGEGKVKVYSATDFKEIVQETFDIPQGVGKVSKMEFSQDGSLLLVTTMNGFVFGYMLSTNMLVANCNELTAVLGTLTEVTILACSSKKRGAAITTVELEAEPNAIALGPFHLATRTGNNVKFYRWVREKTLLKGGELVNEINYEHNIKKMLLNDKWICVLTDKNKVIVNSIEDNKVKEKVFPVEGEKMIIQFFVTKMYLVMLDNTSKLKFYHLEDKNVIM